MPKVLTYPFSAIVALDDLKLALVLNAINPKIGGLLIRGPKGSGKTTAVRALADLLPSVKVAKGCPFNDSPEDPTNMCEKCLSSYMRDGKVPFEERRMAVVDLPLGATEDRVVGSLDVEKAIKMGVEALEPGVLAAANQNILYVDEVNLLPDHIADDLLDAAATGWNVIEREGISIKHPSRFIFVGTMNPEEGQLRPQLLDRFPLSVGAEKIARVKDRIEVVKRNIEFENDPEAFASKHCTSQEELRSRIIQARKALPDVKINDELIQVICSVCLELKVDGIRPDIVITKTARTLAAFENEPKVTAKHILKASELALAHRTREGGFLEPASSDEIEQNLAAKLKEANLPEESPSKPMDKVKGKNEKGKPSSQEKRKKLFPGFGLGRITNKEMDVGKAKNYEGHISNESPVRSSDRAKPDFLFDWRPEKGGKGLGLAKSPDWAPPKLAKGSALLNRIRESRLMPFRFVFKTKKPSRHAAADVGKRAEAVSATHRGRTLGWKVPHGKPSDICFPATIRAAARMQRLRDEERKTALVVHPEDIREKLRIYKAPMTIMFVLDLSESMLHSIDDVREAMLRLHSDAYRYRDKVGIVVFKEMGAVVVQDPTTNLKLVANKLLRLRMSGFTPLAAGMLKAFETLKESKRRDASTIPVMVILTDGETNVPLRRDMLTGELRQINPVDAAFFKYEVQAIKDVISVSEMIKKEGIRTVVVNTTLRSLGQPRAPGATLTELIASMTDGVYHETAKNIITAGQKSASDISDTILKAQRQFSSMKLISPKRKM